MKEVVLRKIEQSELPIKIVGQSLGVRDWVEKFWEEPVTGAEELYRMGMGVLKMEMGGESFDVQNPFAPSFDIGELKTVFQALDKVIDAEPETGLSIALSWLDSSRFSDEHIGRFGLIGLIAKHPIEGVKEMLESRMATDKNPDYIKWAVAEIGKRSEIQS